MILNENEVKTCLLYGLKPILHQYSMTIKEAYLHIDESIKIKAIVTYQDHILDMAGSFTIDYKNGQFIFENIDGKIEYLFLQLNIMSVLKQLIHDEHVVMKENSLYYRCDLPIQDLFIENQHLCVHLRE